jgi:predicted RNA polymerase sigma factor
VRRAPRAAGAAECLGGYPKRAPHSYYARAARPSRWVEHSARADLLRRLGRDQEAATAYGWALELPSNPVERAFLEGRLRELV